MNEIRGILKEIVYGFESLKEYLECAKSLKV